MSAVDTWLIVVIAVVAITGALSLWRVARGRERSLESRRLEAGERRAHEAKQREVAPRDKLAREAGVASFGLNLPWWKRPDSYRHRAGSRRDT